MSLNLASFFSGCGGLDLGLMGGFEANSRSFNFAIEKYLPLTSITNNRRKLLLPKGKITPKFCCDVWNKAKVSWESNISEAHDFRNESIVDLVKQHRLGKKIFPKRIDILTGGFPCQDFSVAGKRRGLKSHRSHKGSLVDSDEPTEANRGQLYFWMREAIDIMQPKLFIAENVKGILSLGDTAEVIKSDFESIGYKVFYQLLNAASYGIPQTRERVFFIGVRLNSIHKSKFKDLSILENLLFPPKSHFIKAKESKLKPPVFAYDYIKDLGEPEAAKDLSHRHYSKCRFYGSHVQGQTEVRKKIIGPTIRAEHHGNIEFRRLSKKNGGSHLDELKLGMKERRLSVRECARLQTFPDSFKFVIKGEKSSISQSDAYKLIGNAVPPILAYKIGRYIESNWQEIFK
ncbi:MAG: DNA (cytosine-5-)-methyltransferase [Zetaproteobacteria bacterium]|nr:DNA (cytosine-5-)-methyltransferase [Pseudobdellovibrionaceae bacterium]